MQTLFDLPADLDTPVSAYLKLQPFGRRFLLESVGGSGRESRYSFLGFGEVDDVRLSSEELLARAVGPFASDKQSSVLAALRSALAAAPRLEGPHGPRDPGPFAGGLVGVAGYGFAQSLAGMTGTRRPAGPDYLGFAPHSVLVFDHSTRRVGLLSASRGSERETLRREVLRALRGPLPKSPASRPARLGELEPSLTQAEFEAAVQTARGEILAGEVYQLVLSIRFQGPSELEPIDVYRALRLLDPSPYLFLFEFEDTAIVGASPEALLRVEDDRAFLQPIAGTRPRGTHDEHDLELERELVGDRKEAAEHMMLVDLARSDLGRIAVPGTVAVEPFREVRRYREVMHLVSGVQATVERDHDVFDAFAAAFPAGTVVGAPKVRAMELIEELEPVSRGLYAGAVGSFGHGGTANQAIAIRSAVFQDGQVAVQAGAGIVLDSSPEREYAEVQAKARSIRTALELAEQGLS